MGNSESNPVRNMDKRTTRRTYHGQFTAAIANYRRGPRPDEPAAAATVGAPASDSGHSESALGSTVRVCVRKRPIHRAELEGLEFDVCTVTTQTGGGIAAIHDARAHSDMRRLLMHHHEFRFDLAFGENDDNEKVYREAASPLV